jgi:hypothetical protein
MVHSKSERESLMRCLEMLPGMLAFFSSAGNRRNLKKLKVFKAKKMNKEITFLASYSISNAIKFCSLNPQKHFYT